jgi:hypothetical protein
VVHKVLLISGRTGNTTKELVTISEGKCTLTVTDSDGSTATHSETITTPKELVVTYTKKDETGIGKNNGKKSFLLKGVLLHIKFFGITPQHKTRLMH